MGVSERAEIYHLMFFMFCSPGHFVPSKGQWRRFLHDYMKDPFANLASPSLDSSSTSNSGTATPTGSNNGSALMMKL